MTTAIYIAVMAGVTYRIRMIPFQKLSSLYTLCGAECHDHTCHLLQHGQYVRINCRNGHSRYPCIYGNAPYRGSHSRRRRFIHSRTFLMHNS